LGPDLEPALDLAAGLEALRPELALAAQAIYNAWDASDPDFGDPEVGFGGICHLIADALIERIQERLPGTVATPVSHDDEVHVSVLVWAEGGDEAPPGTQVVAHSVDINPRRYERGGGYQWTKVPGVTLGVEDVAVGSVRVGAEHLAAILEGG
jgi:hypothetical protein